MQVWADFSPDSMRAAWKEHKMSNIDYSRADEHAPSEFVDFYQGVLADKKFVGYVKQCEDPLLPGAALPRAAQFFEHMAMQYMYFDARLKCGCFFFCTFSLSFKPGLDNDAQNCLGRQRRQPYQERTHDEPRHAFR